MMIVSPRIALRLALLLLPLSASTSLFGQDPFRITVIDKDTEQGVPMIELTTTSNARFITDSAGVIAFDEPGLMDRQVFFHVKGHGYELPADGFGYRGKRLRTTPGGSGTIEISRVNIAERLYRITGQGIYRDSVILGDTTPIAAPVLNGEVTGQDSVLSVVYGGRVFWIWGDTNRVSYPLGNFQASGAWSMLPKDGGLAPSVGIDLNYHVDEQGFSARMLPMDKPGPVWLDGLMVLDDSTDSAGGEMLLARYVRVKTLGELYEKGFAVFDDDQQRFRVLREIPIDEELAAHGHPFRHEVGGQLYYYFPAMYPDTRVRADAASIVEPALYESFTCLKPGSRDGSSHRAIERDANGRAVWGWKHDTIRLTWTDQQAHVRNGHLHPDDTMWHLRDVDTGDDVNAHGGSVYFNAHRDRWIMVCGERFGDPSFLGELWFAEADTPLGPWVYARKIITHDDYSFYNPKHHPFFDEDNGRLIYLEGTYTAMFSGSLDKMTPYYDYNQIMYRLDLSDPRLMLPVPVYEWRLPDGEVTHATGEDFASLPGGAVPVSIAFFAIPPDQQIAGGVGIYEQTIEHNGTRRRVLTVDPPGKARLIGWGMPVPESMNSTPMVQLRRYTDASGERPWVGVGIPMDQSLTEIERLDCAVWSSPVSRHMVERGYADTLRR